MYEKFFGLAHSPFSLTPDPSRFVPTPTHNEALSALYYGIRWRKGIVVVTGEVGSGKTMLLSCLISQLQDSSDLKYAYLVNSRLTPIEFFQYTLTEFDLPATGKNKTEMLLDLSRFLKERGARGLTTTLIVDEAHQLSEDLLEEIRLLSNFETISEKLLQILLVGQPELDEKLDSFGLRQLKQRIAVRAHIGPLNAAETAEYIALRLKSAGLEGQADLIFPAETSALVYRYSRGLPRLINTICENALVAAYAQKTQTVTVQNIEGVVRELRIDVDLLPEMEASMAMNEDGAEDDGNTVEPLPAAVGSESSGLPSETQVAAKGGSQ
jgi:general secretion pathway protein A